MLSQCHISGARGLVHNLPRICESTIRSYSSCLPEAGSHRRHLCSYHLIMFLYLQRQPFRLNIMLLNYNTFNNQYVKNKTYVRLFMSLYSYVGKELFCFRLWPIPMVHIYLLFCTENTRFTVSEVLKIRKNTTFYTLTCWYFCNAR